MIGARTRLGGGAGIDKIWVIFGDRLKEFLTKQIVFNIS